MARGNLWAPDPGVTISRHRGLTGHPTANAQELYERYLAAAQKTTAANVGKHSGLWDRTEPVLSWLLPDDTLAEAQPAALKRSTMLTEPHYDMLCGDYCRLFAAAKAQ